MGGRKALLNALHSALTSHAPRVAAAEALCAAEGRTPLRLTHKGNDSWHLYATATEAERDPRLGAWPWAADLLIAFSPDGHASVCSVSPVLLRKQPGELIVQDWPAAVAYEKAQSPENMTPAAIAKTLDTAEDVASRAVLDPSSADLVSLAQEGLRWARRQSGKSVVRPVLAIPVGTACLAHLAIRREVRPNTEHLKIGAPDEQRYLDTFERTEDSPRVLMAEVDLWGYCYAHTKGKDREAVVEASTSWYHNKEAAHQRLLRHAKDGGDYRLHALPLRTYAPLMGQHHALVSGLEDAVPLDASRNPGWFFGNTEGCERESWKKTYGDLRAVWGRTLRTCRITSLSAVGARLFPSLRDLCERPTRTLPVSSEGEPAPSVKPPRRS